ncbi:MAG TPA: NAD(P)/FAD-dependent oxidoreductase [Pseudonocardiaceae bacterium]|nr:NAD(P)/FAD-dependent oxidoreductase [Pseudonocardiaceae bacterium]
MSKSQRGEFDVVVVGAGFSGLYLLHKLRGLGMSVRVLEAGGGVGGTWYFNRYPGARCDVESVEYGFSFSEELDKKWRWSERYSAQPDILAYLDTVADALDLRRDIQLDTNVASAHYDEAAQRWQVRTEAGEDISARFCVMATGCLSKPKDPDIPGEGSFAGPTYYTSRWPHEGVDFTGLRVGVIGTGSSGVQSIPIIAEQASHLTVLQRTANYAIPAHNHHLPEDMHRPEVLAERRQNGLDCPLGVAFQFTPENQKKASELTAQERQAVVERLWEQGGLTMMLAFADLLVDEEAGKAAAEFVNNKIREQVNDPEVAEILIPKGYPFGAKRLCVDTGYYETYNRDNVTLIDLRATPIESITPAGVRTTGAEFELDALVLATGFDAMTGALAAIDIRGRHGLALKDKWAAGPRTYLGLGVAGFPNLFTVTGPGSPSVLSNMRVSIEQHVDWITDCIRYLDEHNLRTIEATEQAEERWVDHVNEVGEPTVFSKGNSWYVGANVPGKPRVFMPYLGGVPLYRQTCEDVAAKGYEGFELTPA